jgi:hypothetical protein
MRRYLSTAAVAAQRFNHGLPAATAHAQLPVIMNRHSAAFAALLHALHSASILAG